MAIGDGADLSDMRPAEPGRSRGGRPDAVELVLLAAIVAVSLAARLPFLEVPLIRDEGEYAHMAQEIRRGAVPYLDVYNQKTPLLFYLLALVQAVFGESLAAMRGATAAWGVFGTLATWAAARGIFGGRAGLLAAAAFVTLVFDQCGILHQTSTEFFSLPWIALAVYLSCVRRRGAAYFLAGVCAGLAYQTKQTALVVAVFLIVERLLRGRAEPERGSPAKDAGTLLLGFAAVQALVLTYFFARGAGSEYIECTWTNNWSYVGERGGIGAKLSLLSDALGGVAGPDLALWILGTAGLALAARRREPRGRGTWILLAGLLAAALGAGKAYRHYYEPLIVPLALGLGFLGARLLRTMADDRRSRWVRAGALLLFVVPWLAPARQAVNLVRMDEARFRDLIDAFPPFDSAQSIADYLRERTTPEDTVLILGSEPEVYFHADRRAASRLVFTYPLIAPYDFSPSLQDELIRDLEERPAYVVQVQVLSSLSEFAGAIPPFQARTRPTLRRHYTVEATWPPAETGEPTVWVVHRRR